MDVAVELIVPVSPFGTNSTMFTGCCGVAICDGQARCPACNHLVIGHDAATDHERGHVRWRFATAHWKRARLEER